MSVAAAVKREAGIDAAEFIRANCYRVLARLFAAAPDAGLMAHLADSASAAPSGDLGESWNALCAEAAKVSAGGTAAGDALAQAYTEIFCAIGEPRVMLYGSWYLTGALMDAPLARLRTDLAQLGFERQPEVTEPEDHVAALCEVMAELITAGSPAQAEFFLRHLAPWYGRLCAALAAEESGFYRAAAEFARSFLDGENELLAL